MYVLDAEARTIHVFSSAGQHLRSFGRRGEGPGELRNPIGMDWGPDGTLWVIDSGNSRYTVFDRSGNLVATHPRNVTVSAIPWNGGIAGHTLYDVGASSSDQTPSDALLYRVDLSSMAVETSPLPNYFGGLFVQTDEEGIRRGLWAIPFSAKLMLRVDPRGFIWKVSSDRYHFVKESASGHTVLTAGRDLDAPAVTREERAEAVARLESYVAAGGNFDASRIPSHRPVVADLLVDDQGFLWTLPSGVTDAWQYDVFDREGRHAGEVRSQIPFVSLISTAMAPVIRGGYVYGFVLDELHVPYLVRARIDGRS